MHFKSSLLSALATLIFVLYVTLSYGQNFDAADALMNNGDRRSAEIEERYQMDVQSALKYERLNQSGTGERSSNGQISAKSFAVDSDEDGMPDSWESANGLDPNDASDAWSDSDNDQVVNLFEFQLSSDPNNTATPVKVNVASGSNIGTEISSAPDNSVLRIEGGIYVVNYITFGSERIMLQGGWNSSFTVRDLQSDSTIFDGNNLDEVLYFSFNSDSNTVILDGLTIINGLGSFGAVNCITDGTASCHLSILDCEISNSESTFNFGGVTNIFHWDGVGDAFIARSIIANNRSSGIYNQCTGGGLGTWRILNTDITNNSSVDPQEGKGISGLSLDSSRLHINLINTILWGNEKADLFFSNNSGLCSFESNYTDIDSIAITPSLSSYFEGNGVINSDPNFVDAVGGDFSLLPSSPCIDAGIPVGLPYVGGLPDIGAIEYQSQGHDAGILSIDAVDSFCAGMKDVSVQLKNYHTDTLNDVIILWSLDNALQDSISWTGSLAPGDTSALINLGSSNFSQGPAVEVRAWTFAPNGIWDMQNVNDSSSLSVTLVEETPIALAADTVICFSDSFAIDAGSSYSNYLWQDSTATQVYIVYATGTYSVSVTDSAGCPSTDSIDVTMVAPFQPTITQSGDTLVSSAQSSYQWYVDSFLIQWANGQEYIPPFPGAYMVESFQNGCGAFSDAIIITGIEVKLGQDVGFLVYPNPIHEKVTLIKLHNKISRFSIYDVRGNLIHSDDLLSSMAIVDLSDFPAGVYFIQMSWGNEVFQEKVVKD